MRVNFILLLLMIAGIFLGSLVARQPQPGFTKQTLSDTLIRAKKFDIVDLDFDGDYDIVAASNDTTTQPIHISWFENDGSQNFTEHIVSTNFFGARVALAADLNNDGFPDIIGGADGRYPLTWWESDGSPADGGWTIHTISVPDSTIYGIDVKDFNGDGFLDIAASYFNADNDTGGDKVRRFMNNGDGTFSEDTLVQNYEAATSVFIDDINNDGAWDILTTAGGKSNVANDGKDISWWQNDGSENFSQNIISSDFEGPWFVSTADMDGNNTPDIIASSWIGDKISWWSNDGSGNFAAEQVIVSGFTETRSAFGIDMDGDADTDALGSADGINTIAWFENDGSENFTTRNITTTFNYAYHALPFDLDGDGDMDVIGTAQDDHELAWFANDQDDNQILAQGNPDTAAFWNNQVLIDFKSGYSGGETTVFFNHNPNTGQTDLGTGVDAIADSGFYTIVTDAALYDADLIFDYTNISAWQKVSSDESKLRICLWDEDSARWIIAGSFEQAVDTVQNLITVPGITCELRSYSKFTMAKVSTVSGLIADKRSGKSLLPARIELDQNYPNPFNNVTTISLNIEGTKQGNITEAELTLFDVLGSNVRTLFKGDLTAGRHTFVWDGRDNAGRLVASGNYIYRLRIGNRQISKMLMLQK